MRVDVNNVRECEQLRVNVKRDNFSFDWVRLDIAREQKRFMERRIKSFSDLNMNKDFLTSESECHIYTCEMKRRYEHPILDLRNLFKQMSES